MRHRKTTSHVTGWSFCKNRNKRAWRNGEDVERHDALDAAIVELCGAGERDRWLRVHHRHQKARQSEEPGKKNGLVGYGKVSGLVRTRLWPIEVGESTIKNSYPKGRHPDIENRFIISNDIPLCDWLSSQTGHLQDGTLLNVNPTAKTIRCPDD